MSQTRIQPAFPALNEVTLEELVSDHLLIKTEVPLPTGGKLKLLSYNFMDRLIQNNLLTTAQQTPESEKRRYQRQLRGLLAAAKSENADGMVTQEVAPDIMKDCLSLLGDEWYCVPDPKTIDKVQPRQFTFLRKSSLELQSEQPWDEKRRTLSITVKVKATGTVVHLHNVWSQYDFFPEKTEDYYRELLAKKGKEEVVVILGDTNSRLAPVGDKTRQNLTTGVIPRPFNKDDYSVSDDVQIGDHPDGGFYTDKDGKIKQCVIAPMDITTGQDAKDKRDMDVVLSSLSPEAQRVWHVPRPILCLDGSYQETKWEDLNDQTLFEFEKTLRDSVDSKMTVRETSTLLNERGIVLRFTLDKRLVVNIAILMGLDICRQKSVQSADLYTTKPSPCIFVKEENLKAFVAKLTPIKNILQLLKQRNGDMNSNMSSIQQIIPKLKKMTDVSLEAAITEASKKYAEETGTFSSLFKFGFSGAEAGISDRIKSIREKFQKGPEEKTAFNLLAAFLNEETKDTTTAFKYFLCSELTGQEVKTNEEAAKLVNLVKDLIEPAKIFAQIDGTKAISSASLPSGPQ